MQRHLIIGGSGQLGSAFRRLLPDAAAPPRATLDITSPSDLRLALRSINPVAIINCSGYTDVDGAEDDEAGALAVNATGVGIAAAIADNAGVPFVTFSTDYVFDGRSDQPYVESSSPNPINAYGRSKLAGECLAREHGNSLVIRTSWVLSMTHRNFVTTILERALTSPLRVVSDQMGCPTFAEDVAATTLRVLDSDLKGVLHLASGPPTSWHGLAQVALDMAGLDPAVASACTSSEYPNRAERPKWSVLGSERLEKAAIEELPAWTVRLPELVAATPSA